MGRMHIVSVCGRGLVQRVVPPDGSILPSFSAPRRCVPSPSTFGWSSLKSNYQKWTERGMGITRYALCARVCWLRVVGGGHMCVFIPSFVWRPAPLCPQSVHIWVEFLKE